MNKGYVHTTEAIILFTIWITLLASAWEQTYTQLEKEKEKIGEYTRISFLIQTTNQIILTHHVNAWKGCATYSESARRVYPYVIPSTCLTAWKENQPPEEIEGMIIRTKEEKISVYEKENDKKNCIALPRPIIWDKQPAVLELIDCE
ncbi:MAG: hypothetical protein V1776_02165 [Candidatus Diapherotrites archaeon]